MTASDATEGLLEDVRDAARAGVRLLVRGHGSKVFLYDSSDARVLPTERHAGVVDYSPEELVLTARAGTPLAAVRTILAEAGQMLAFDPPEFSGGTFGGALAAGLSGPGRPWYGAVRDAVLGVEIVNGLGERLAFGGKVMKNVAGYDVSRLMVGSHGTLALVLSASVRVLPMPERESTLAFSCGPDEALRRVVAWGREPLPLTATCHVDDALTVRLSGTARGVADAVRRLGGDEAGDGAAFWGALRDHRLPFFSGRPLWRVSLPPSAPFPDLGQEAQWLTEWGGALRWLVTDAPAPRVRAAVARLGGHAHAFSSPGGFAPVDPIAATYHARLKAAFDPNGVFESRHFPLVAREPAVDQGSVADRGGQSVAG